VQWRACRASEERTRTTRPPLRPQARVDTNAGKIRRR
jgi:hypothetical protein